ncbi:replication-relaxation family protein [Saccharothrix sp. NPDC042600]|uniref:replication-relaxation family protein n=1 Tax=Saccharothrix TaxID=2071 RepID=UPI0033E69EE9|nr:replication-relaxation family protein [Saccharothrix mutabilis subsp. capreolus]
MTISRAVLDALQPQLTDRDRAIIHDVGRFKLATAGQLERLHFAYLPPKSRPRNRQAVLKRLTDHHILARVGSRGRGGPGGGSQGYLYTLDTVGHDLAQLTSARPRRPYVPFDPTIAHYLAVTELYVQLVEADRAGHLTLLKFETEPYSWRYFGNRQVLKPDAYVQLGVVHDGRRRKGSFFIEIDRGTQWGAKIAVKVPQYLAYYNAERPDGPVFPKVLLLAPNERRAAYLGRLIERRAGDLRAFVTGVGEHVLPLLLYE